VRDRSGCAILAVGFRREQAEDFCGKRVAAARFDQHVIRAGGPSAILVLAIAITGDRQERNVPGARVGAEAPAQLEAVDARDGDVGEDESGDILDGFVERLQSIVSLVGPQPDALQHKTIELSRLHIVFDDEDQR
jgi:hypothetical protein